MATFKQAKKLIEVFENVDTDEMQRILGSEILGVIRDQQDLVVQFMKVARGLAEIVMMPLLALVNPNITVSAHEHFVVADNFKKGNAGIYYISDNFKKWFGDKVEENIPTATLSSRKLVQSSVDGPIKAELGQNHETFLSWLFENLEVQADGPDGREGDLLVDGYANIFYVDGRVVDVYWYASDGWGVDACEVTNPGAWDAGIRVFSRNSSVLVSSDALVSVEA